MHPTPSSPARDLLLRGIALSLPVRGWEIGRDLRNLSGVERIPEAGVLALDARWGVTVDSELLCHVHTIFDDGYFEDTGPHIAFGFVREGDAAVFASRVSSMLDSAWPRAPATAAGLAAQVVAETTSARQGFRDAGVLPA